MELALELGMGEGKSAAALSRDIRKYLVEPNKLFRRVRDKSGALRLSKAAAAYHPGQGVYRSSYKNALRMTATENNIAYRTADHNRWQALPFVIGIEIHISNNHPTEDICDLFDDKRFPKDFKFTGWHPWCRCYAVSVLASQEEMDAYTTALMNGEDVSNWKFTGQVEKMPKEFNKWMKDNQARIENATSMPYFIKDNFKDGNPAKGLRWKGKNKQSAQWEPSFMNEEQYTELTRTMKITPEQHHELYDGDDVYIDSSWSRQINKELASEKVRGDIPDNFMDGDTGTIRQCKVLDAVIKANTLKEDTYVYRKVTEDWLNRDGVSFTEGNVIHEFGYTSTSAVEGNTYMSRKTVRMNIKIPKGTHAYVSENINESEIILGRNSKFLVKSVKHEGKNTIIDLELQPQIVKSVKTKHEVIMENAAKRHAARTSEQIVDIKDAWRERRLDAYDNRANQLMKTLTYSQGQTLPALTKRQIALRNAIGKDASVKEVEALFAKFEKGVKIQNEWDTQVWANFSKEQIANMRDIEKSLGIKKGRPMTYEEADRQSANPRHVNEYIADASSRIKIRGTNIHVRKNPLYDAAKHEQYGINCQTCAPAYALREWGFNIYAKGNTKALGDLSNYLSKGNNWLETWTEKDGSAVNITSFKDYLKAHPSWKHMTQQRYLQYFDDVCKEGGTYEVGLSWEPRGGHCTIVKRFSDGSIKYIEPQEDNSEGSGFEEMDIKYLCANMRKDPILKDGAIKVSDKLLNIKYVSIFLK